jgi:hypothetical protein
LPEDLVEKQAPGDGHIERIHRPRHRDAHERVAHPLHVVGDPASLQARASGRGESAVPFPRDEGPEEAG